MKTQRKQKLTLAVLLSVCALTLAACSDESITSSGPASSDSSNSDEVKTVDKEALKRRLEFVEENYLNNANLYTEASFQALSTAYADAKEVYDDEGSTQEEVDSALAALNAAITSLVTVIQPSSSIDDILNYVDEANGNYTITFNDYMQSEEGEEFTYYFDGDGFYDLDKNFGLTAFGDYMHAFSIIDGEVDMDRAVLAEKLLPSYLLTPAKLTNAVKVIGKSEQFTSFGLDIYGFFVTVPDETYYVLDNENYYEWFLGLTYNRYDISSDEAASIFSKATLELKDDELIGQLYDLDDKLAFQFTVSNIGKTTIPELVSYKSSHTSYIADPSYNPATKMAEIYQTYADSNYGIKIDLYSNRTGREDQSPDLSVTDRYNPDGNSYLVSSNNEGYLSTAASNNKITISGDSFTLGAETEVDISSCNLFEQLLKDSSKLTLKTDTDEYHLSLENEAALKETLKTIFFMDEYSSWASEGKYGGSPSYSSDFDSVSLSVNKEGYLTITLWNGDNFIARGVIRSYQDEVIQALEAQDSSSLESLYERVKDISNSDGTYSEASFEQFEAARSAVASFLSAPDEMYVDEYYEMLNNAYNGLEDSDYVADTEMEAKVTTYIQETIYDDEYSSTPNSYRMEVTVGDTTSSYVMTSKYVVNETSGEGMLVTDSAVYNFEINDGSVNLLSPVVHSAGYQYNYLSRAVDYLQNISIIGIEPTFIRMNNSSDIYTSTSGFLDFVPGVEDVSGVSFSLDGDVLSGKAYTSLGIEVESDALSSVERSYLTRKEAASFKITTADAKNETVESYLAKDAYVNKEDIISKISQLGDTISIEDKISGQKYIIGSNFYYDVTGESIYALNSDGQVAEFNLNYSEESQLPFTILNNPVLDENEAPVTDMKSLVGDIFALKNLSADNLSLEEGKHLNYSIGETVSSDISKALGLGSDADLRVTLIDGEVVISQYGGSRVDSYFVLSSSLTASEESDVTMINNIINFFL